MSASAIFPGVYRVQGDERELIATVNLTPGRNVYGEQLLSVEGIEYRLWSPFRSKLGAAIEKGLKSLSLNPGDSVLYLGVASGTTCSHISDIVGVEGHIWAVDFAPRSMRDFITNVVHYRKNLSPILGDARRPDNYASMVPEVDIIYADVAQPDQADIVLKNAGYFLKPGGKIMLAIKSRSVDVTRPPSEIYKEQKEILEQAFKVDEMLELDPFEKAHAFITATYLN